MPVEPLRERFKELKKQYSPERVGKLHELVYGIHDPKFTNIFGKFLKDQRIIQTAELILSSKNDNATKINQLKKLILENLTIRGMFKLRDRSPEEREKVFRWILSLVVHNIKYEGRLTENPFLYNRKKDEKAPEKKVEAPTPRVEFRVETPGVKTKVPGTRVERVLETEEALRRTIDEKPEPIKKDIKAPEIDVQKTLEYIRGKRSFENDLTPGQIEQLKRNQSPSSPYSKKDLVPEEVFKRNTAHSGKLPRPLTEEEGMFAKRLALPGKVEQKSVEAVIPRANEEQLELVPRTEDEKRLLAERRRLLEVLNKRKEVALEVNKRVELKRDFLIKFILELQKARKSGVLSSEKFDEIRKKISSLKSNNLELFDYIASVRDTYLDDLNKVGFRRSSNVKSKTKYKMDYGFNSEFLISEKIMGTESLYDLLKSLKWSKFPKSREFLMAINLIRNNFKPFSRNYFFELKFWIAFDYKDGSQLLNFVRKSVLGNNLPTPDFIQRLGLDRADWEQLLNFSKEVDEKERFNYIMSFRDKSLKEIREILHLDYLSPNSKDIDEGSLLKPRRDSESPKKIVPVRAEAPYPKVDPKFARERTIRNRTYQEIPNEEVPRTESIVKTSDSGNIRQREFEDSLRTEAERRAKILEGVRKEKEVKRPVVEEGPKQEVKKHFFDFLELRDLHGEGKGKFHPEDYLKAIIKDYLSWNKEGKGNAFPQLAKLFMALDIPEYKEQALKLLTELFSNLPYKSNDVGDLAERDRRERVRVDIPLVFEDFEKNIFSLDTVPKNMNLVEDLLNSVTLYIFSRQLIWLNTLKKIFGKVSHDAFRKTFSIGGVRNYVNKGQPFIDFLNLIKSEGFTSQLTKKEISFLKAQCEYGFKVAKARPQDNQLELFEKANRIVEELEKEVDTISEEPKKEEPKQEPKKTITPQEMPEREIYSKIKFIGQNGLEDSTTSKRINELRQKAFDSGMVDAFDANVEALLEHMANAQDAEYIFFVKKTPEGDFVIDTDVQRGANIKLETELNDLLRYFKQTLEPGKQVPELAEQVKEYFNVRKPFLMTGEKRNPIKLGEFTYTLSNGVLYVENGKGVINSFDLTSTVSTNIYLMSDGNFCIYIEGGKNQGYFVVGSEKKDKQLGKDAKIVGNLRYTKTVNDELFTLYGRSDLVEEERTEKISEKVLESKDHSSALERINSSEPKIYSDATENPYLDLEKKEGKLYLPKGIVTEDAFEIMPNYIYLLGRFKLEIYAPGKPKEEILLKSLGREISREHIMFRVNDLNDGSIEIAYLGRNPINPENKISLNKQGAKQEIKTFDPNKAAQEKKNEDILEEFEDITPSLEKREERKIIPLLRVVEEVIKDKVIEIPDITNARNRSIFNGHELFISDAGDLGTLLKYNGINETFGFKNAVIYVTDQNIYVHKPSGLFSRPKTEVFMHTRNEQAIQGRKETLIGVVLVKKGIVELSASFN